LNSFKSNDTNWLKCLGNSTRVNDFLEALSKTRASAISLENCGLTDKCIRGIAALFLNNSTMLVCNMKGSDVRSIITIDYIQKLAEASPYILGMEFDIYNTSTKQIRDYVYIDKPMWVRNTGAESGWKPALGCCAKDEYTFKQNTMTIKLVNDPNQSQKNQISQVAEAIDIRVNQNKIMPVTYVLKELFKNSEKRLKFFSQACKDPRYKGIFDIQLDNEKIKYFSSFFNKHTIAIEAEAMFEGMFETEEGNEGFGGDFVPVQGQNQEY